MHIIPNLDALDDNPYNRNYFITCLYILKGHK